MTLLKLDDVAVNVRQWGTGEPVVFAHGLGMNGDLFFNQVRPFSEKYHMVTVDLRGFGRSDKPRHEGAYLIERLAEDIAGVIRALDIGPAHFVGTSMGGYIGITLGLNAPELCRSVSLCHTAHSASIPREVVQTRLAALKKQTMEEYAKLVSSQALAQPADAIVQEWVEEMVARNDREIYTQILTEGLGTFDESERVSSLSLPTLVLVGDEDRVIPPERGREIAASVKGARLVEIQGVGHLSYMERPDVFNAAVLDFLAQV